MRRRSPPHRCCYPTAAAAAAAAATPLLPTAEVSAVYHYTYPVLFLLRPHTQSHTVAAVAALGFILSSTS